MSKEISDSQKGMRTRRDTMGAIVLALIVAVCVYAWYQTSDFALALVLITAAFFVIWIVDRIAFRPRRVARAIATDQKRRDPLLVDYARSFFPVLLAVLLFRTFLIEPFRIPSGSMMPTLRVGDFILVNKFDYGLRLPVTNTKILSIGEPHRGDVAVFRYPRNPKERYIKRIIGLPGDTVVIKGEQVTVNGKPIRQTLIGPYRGTDKTSIEMEENPSMSPVTEYTQTLDGVKFHTLRFAYTEPDPCTDGTRLPGGGCKWVVPKDDYFAMGDNRDDSADSRYWGYVPRKNLEGKAFFIWFSLANWHRIGTVLN